MTDTTSPALALGKLTATQDILRLLAMAPNQDVFIKLLLEYAESVDKQETGK